MRSYKCIPFDKLRRQYHRERRIKKNLVEAITGIIVFTVYGIVMGVMMTFL